MKTRYMIITSIVIGLFSSCSTNMYVSNTVNVPLLKEKGEVKLNVDENDAQAAVAVTDHLGIIANGFYKKYEGKDYFDHSGKLGEIGFGYFTPLKSNWVFETYAGLGMGSVTKKVSYTNSENVVMTNSFNAHGAKAFIQPNIGYSTRYFDFALTPKFSFVKYTSFSYWGFSQEELKESYLDNNKLTKGFYTFAEPALTLRAGYRFLKIQAQYGLTLKLGNQEIAAPSQFGSVGLVFDFAKWHSNKPVKRK